MNYKDNSLNCAKTCRKIRPFNSRFSYFTLKKNRTENTKKT